VGPLINYVTKMGNVKQIFDSAVRLHVRGRYTGFED